MATPMNVVLTLALLLVTVVAQRYPGQLLLGRSSQLDRLGSLVNPRYNIAGQRLLGGNSLSGRLNTLSTRDLLSSRLDPSILGHRSSHLDLDLHSPHLDHHSSVLGHRSSHLDRHSPHLDHLGHRSSHLDLHSSALGHRSSHLDRHSPHLDHHSSNLGLRSSHMGSSVGRHSRHFGTSRFGRRPRRLEFYVDHCDECPPAMTCTSLRICTPLTKAPAGTVAATSVDLSLPGPANTGHGGLCTLPPDAGTCEIRVNIRYYWDVAEGDCKMFSYSKCGGNANRFMNKRSCRERCGMGLV